MTSLFLKRWTLSRLFTAKARPMSVSQCAYYLASKGAEIRLDSPKKDERPVFTFKGQTKKVNIKTFVVGHYLMERYKKEANGKAPTWRHYWCGNGRERRECKFSF